MKLLNFEIIGENHIRFGVVLEDRVIPFTYLSERYQKDDVPVDMMSFLSDLPAGQARLKSLYNAVTQNLDDKVLQNSFAFDDIRILPVVPQPQAILDFALSPEHLEKSGMNMLRRETGPLLRFVLGNFLRRKIKKMKFEKDFKFYKGNHNAIIGHDDQTYWPPYTSYLDIEPELAVITGKVQLGMSEADCKDAIAGYVIFNDFSARDVQMPEMLAMTGPLRSKDFERGNGIGPFLVTPDEVPEPLGLAVEVRINERLHWTGHTSGYMATPAKILQYVAGFRSLPAASLIAMGTVPNCCGLDRDEWIRPGDVVDISFESLGTLRQRIPSDLGPLEKSRWKARPELKKFYLP